ncbi:MAG TPA: hypothetical protein VGF24_37285 [Vicinamibacterales bacterium]
MVGGVLVVVFVILRLIERPDHHHKWKIGFFFERNGDKPDDDQSP